MRSLPALLALGLLFTGSLEVHAQRTWLDQVLAPTDRTKAAYYREPAGRSGDSYVGRIHSLDGRLKAEGTYADASLTVPHGRFAFYHPDGKLESTGDYTNGNKSGVWQRFDRWGGALAEKVYDTKALENIEYTLVKTMPRYPGGEKEMVRAVREKVGRKVSSDAMASFVVEKDGRVSDVKVSGADDRTAETIAGVITSANWSAGQNDGGIPVRVRMSVPLK